MILVWQFKKYLGHCVLVDGDKAPRSVIVFTTF